VTPAATTEAAKQRDRDETAPVEGTKRARPNGFVCMIAYTVYAFDARVRREAETLAANGFTVRCLTTRSGPSPARFVLNGVEVRELNVPKYRGKSKLAYAASYLWFLVATSAVCLRLLVARELDVVHAHNLPDFLVFAGLLPRLLGRKVVLDVHDSVPETFATKFSRSPLLWRVLCLEERLSALVAHRVICVNHPQRDTLVTRGIPKAKTLVSMNAPDPAIFTRTPMVQRGEERDGAFNLVYHGTMSERLGVDLLIRAVAQLQHRLPHARLHLWGAGDDIERFQDLVQALGVGERVSFSPKGFALHELPQRLRSMHVGVVGNRRSAAGDLMLPVKLLEYVSLDIPAIVPRLPTIEHYFTDDMVWYYEPDSVGSLSEAILQLYSRPDVRSEQAARARAFIERHGWERQGAELVAEYQALVESRNR
jgi:glycosyltransferase involved in cell wall biosynthesis